MPLILAGMVLTGLFTFIFPLNIGFLWLLVDVGILIAITNSLTQMWKSLVPDLIPLERRGRINTLLTVMTPIGSGIIWIPSLITLLVNGGSMLGEITIIQFGSIILAIMGIAVFPLVHEPPVVKPPIGWTNDLRQTLQWSELKMQGNFLKLFFANFFLNASGNAIFLNLFNFVSSINFEWSQVETYIIYGAIAATVMGIGIYFLGRSIDKIGRKWITAVGFAFAPLGAMVLAFSNGSILLLMMGFAAFFPFFWAGSTAFTVWQQDILPPDKRARFFGLINITSAIGTAVGGYAASVVADRFGVPWIFPVAALFLLASLPIISRVPETLVKSEKTSK